MTGESSVSLVTPSSSREMKAPVSSSSFRSKHPSQVYPSMLRLMGMKDWNTLRHLIRTGVYDDIIHDKVKMSSILSFAVDLKVPHNILDMMCNLNPDALLMTGDLPFRIAKQQRSHAQTIIILEAARQKAFIKIFQ